MLIAFDDTIITITQWTCYNSPEKKFFSNFIKSKNTLLKVTPSDWESYSEYFHGSAN